MLVCFWKIFERSSKITDIIWSPIRVGSFKVIVIKNNAKYLSRLVLLRLFFE